MEGEPMAHVLPWAAGYEGLCQVPVTAGPEAGTEGRCTYVGPGHLGLRIDQPEI